MNYVLSETPGGNTSMPDSHTGSERHLELPINNYRASHFLTYSSLKPL